MILSDRDIKKELRSKEITIKPFQAECLQPASYDVHLDRHFLVFNVNSNFVIDPRDISKDLMQKVSISKTEPFILHPGEFALGVLLEETGVSDKLVGRLEGKSSLGRLGLIIHTTAGFLDAGNPGLDQFFLGTVTCRRVEDVEAIAAQTFGRLQALIRLPEHLRHAGNFLADLHAADADGECKRVFTQIDQLAFECRTNPFCPCCANSPAATRPSRPIPHRISAASI